MVSFSGVGAAACGSPVASIVLDKGLSAVCSLRGCSTAFLAACFWSVRFFHACSISCFSPGLGTEAGKSHRLCQGLEPSNPVVQWHMAEVKRVPEGAVVLASSDSCVAQCVAINDHAIGTQFHSECSPQTVAGWTATPGYVPLYEKHRGPGSYRQFVEEAYPLMHRMTAMTRRIYDNLVESSGLRR